ncbi:MAG: deoxyribodipyrimidine photo-lyase [Sedimentisphaerales bacterium]|nr:deoxyribodipyrimidine photo-lyase [Sedimentisphaerales bacterium]
MIQEERIEILNDEKVRDGEYVLYWMQAAQRSEYNHALEYAIRRANELQLPVLVFFGITDKFPQANLRHYYFMLEGLKQTQKALGARGIKLIVRIQSPEEGIVVLAKKAALVVVDSGQLRIQRQWRLDAANKVECPFYEVETNLIVPIEEATDKENFSAGTLRPRITKQLDKYLVPLKHTKPKKDSLSLKIESVEIDDIDKVLSNLKIDKSVGKVEFFHGGTDVAKRLLKGFIKNKLDKYDTLRNNPCEEYSSNMSPYLHFGQISALYIALEVMKTNSPGKDAFLEELIVRRELSHNFVYYNYKYDTFASLPNWAKRTLNVHRTDKREYVYDKEQFENAQTHDPYWNAAQKEMVITGKMHGYMRMYWGKKILEWSRNPQTGFKIALELNNKYELDGRDANAFAGVAWCFGKHDRAWGERDVFGKIRYMNAAGLKRKFNPDAYVEKINALEKADKGIS